MVALVNEENRVSGSLHNEELLVLLTLLKQKLEEAIVKEDKISVIITNSLTECRNTFYINDCEVYENYLYLNEGNYEIHINLNNETELKYNETDEIFSIVHNNSEINLYF